MFEDVLIERRARNGSKWTVALATALQCLLVAALLLVPLLNYYELPMAGFVSFLTAPPPPPPPAPVTTVEAKAEPREFDTGTLSQPVAIPERVAVIEEASPPPGAGIASVVGSISGTDSVNGVTGGLIDHITQQAARPLPPPPVVKKVERPTRIRVGGNVAKARLTRQVRPQYPALARQARIQGKVRLAAVISKDGSIQELKVLSGHPLLVPAALSAVKQWRYKPTQLNGEPVEVLTSIEVNFTLSG